MPEIQTTRVTEIHGTMDEMQPALEAAGFTGIRTMAGVSPLATADPYGMRGIGSVNIRGPQDAHHFYRGVLVYHNETPYLADANADGTIRRPDPPFIGGLFPLVSEPTS